MQSKKEMHSEEMIRLSRQIMATYRKIACIYEYELEKEKVLDGYFEALEERWLNLNFEIDLE